MPRQKHEIKHSNTMQAINQSALNNSTTKALVSFTKAQRFSKAKKTGSYFMNKYKTEPSLITMQATRLPTIPKAKRVFYFDKEKEKQPYPSPDSYNVKMQDEVWRVAHVGQTIGKKCYRSLDKQKYPGPSDYSKPDTSKQSFNRSFTFYKSGRELNQFLKKDGKDSPGPKYIISDDILSKRLKTRTTFIREDLSKKIFQSSKKLAKNNRFKTELLQKELIEANKTKTSLERTTSPYAPKQYGRCTFSHRKFDKPKPLTPGPSDYSYFSQFSGWR